MNYKGLVHSNACLVYIYSPGGVHPYFSLTDERNALWVYRYPGNGSLRTTL